MNRAQPLWIGMLSSVALLAAARAAPEIPVLHRQTELLVDRSLVTEFDGTELRLATPVSGGKALLFDRPWEGPFSLTGTVIHKEDGTYQMFYRGQGGVGPTICTANSPDGIHWTRPDLHRVAIQGSTANNALALSAGPADSDRFNRLGSMTVLYDNRPGVPRRERYKAVRPIGRPRGLGLQLIVSADGLTWEPFDPSAPPIALLYALDSANVITWVPADHCYAIYMRCWTGDTPGVTPKEPNEMGKISPYFHGVRTLMRSVSTDLVHWSEPRRMDFGGAPLEHLYTNATQPYFRAPQILVSMPMRFDPDARHAALTVAEMKRVGISPLMWAGVSDSVFMTSRGGGSFDRTFLDSFVRPGPDPRNWAARSQIVAVGVVPTGPTEMSFYVNRAYGTHDAYVERMTLRLDGFASLHADRPGGRALTRAICLDGDRLWINYSSSPFGFVKVAFLDPSGAPIPGFTEADADPIKGDQIRRVVTWKSGRTLADLKQRPVRMEFLIQDADLYAFGIEDSSRN